MNKKLIIAIIASFLLSLSPVSAIELKCDDDTDRGTCNSEGKYCGSENLISNAGFEMGSANFEKVGDSVKLDYSTYYAGEVSMKITSSDSSFGQNIDVIAGNKYNLIAYAYGYCHNAAFYHGVSTKLTEYSSAVYTEQWPWNNQNSWELLTLTFTPTVSETLRNLRVVCIDPGDIGYLYVDSMHMELLDEEAEPELTDNCAVCGCQQGMTCGITGVCEVKKLKDYSYIHAGAQKVARIDENNVINYYHSDHLGSTSKMTSEDGNIVFSADYFPFGSELRSEGDDTRFKYTGKELDDESGWYYYGARYYDPEIGRFVSVDPKPNINRYVYVRNNPLKLVDPSGMEATTITFKLSIDEFKKNRFGFETTLTTAAYRTTDGRTSRVADRYHKLEVIVMQTGKDINVHMRTLDIFDKRGSPVQSYQLNNPTIVLKNTQLTEESVKDVVNKIQVELGSNMEGASGQFEEAAKRFSWAKFKSEEDKHAYEMEKAIGGDFSDPMSKVSNPQYFQKGIKGSLLEYGKPKENEEKKPAEKKPAKTSKPPAAKDDDLFAGFD